jgi:predicted small integral membrane protein
MQSGKGKGGDESKRGDKRNGREDTADSDEHGPSQKSMRLEEVPEKQLSDFLSQEQIAVAESLMLDRDLEDDPIIVVRWRSMRLQAFFRKLAALAAAPPTPPGMANAVLAAQAGNIDGFMDAIGDYWTSGTGVTPVDGIFFPATTQGSHRVFSRIVGSAFLAWWGLIDAAAPTTFPLVRIFVIKPHSTVGEVERIADLIPTPGLFID